MKTSVDLCPLCGGTKIDGSTTFTVDLKETLVVIRDVPATLCSLCGNEWLSDETTSDIEAIVKDAKEKSHSIEVTQFRKVA
jgi:YgiT-type zinc finger domain-containing protein